MAKLGQRCQTFKILAVLLLVISSFYYFYVVRVLDREALKTKEQRRLSTFSPQDVKKLEIRNRLGKFDFEKKDGVWMMFHPSRAKGDDFAINSIIEYIEKIDIKRNIIDEGGPAFSKYGLKEPFIEVSISTTNVPRPWGLALGDLTPDGLGVYARKAEDPEVLILPMYLTLLLNQDAYALRDKTLFHFSPGKSMRLEIQFGRNRIALRRAAVEDWEIVEPVSAIADSEAVKEVVAEIGQIRVSSFVEEEPKNLNLYGLDDPWAKITVSDQDNFNQTVVFGLMKEREGFFAKRLDTANVVLIPITVATLFLRDISFLRDKTVLRFKDDEIVAFEVNDAGKGERLILERNKGGGWKITIPEDLAADSDAVADYFSDLRLARCKQFIPYGSNRERTYGLTTPELTIVLKRREQNPPLMLNIGKASSKNPGWFFAKRSDQSEVMLLDRKDVETLKRTVHDLRCKQLLLFNIDEVTKVNLLYTQRCVSLERGKKRVWRALRPRKMRLSENLSVFLLLRDLWRFKFAKIFSPSDMEKEIQIPPEITVDLWLKEDQHLATFSMWNYKGLKNSVVVKLGNKIYLVEGQFVKLLRIHLAQIYGQLGLAEKGSDEAI